MCSAAVYNKHFSVIDNTFFINNEESFKSDILNHFVLKKKVNTAVIFFVRIDMILRFIDFRIVSNELNVHTFTFLNRMNSSPYVAKCA